METTTSNWKIEGLAAEGPHTEYKEKLMLFGQFVGDWDILECKYLNENGFWSTTRGKLHWRWILEGRALQDIWSTIDEKTGKYIPDGTTVRFYDSKIDAWQSVWISPSQNRVRNFIGKQIGNEVVLEGKNEKGYQIKWIFYDITPCFFKWRAEESGDNGKTWKIREEMRIQKEEK